MTNKLAKHLVMFLFAACALWSRPAQGQEVRIRHLPPSSAASGSSLTVTAIVADGWRSSLLLQYRVLGQREWQTREFALTAGRNYLAVVPKTALVPPGFEYYVISKARDPGTVTVPQFASQENPHRVTVYDAPMVARTKKDLAASGGQRRRLRVSFQWVDFGSRPFEVMGGAMANLPDRYTRLEADFTYRLLAYPIRTIRFGGTQLLGEIPIAARGDNGECRARTAEECTQEAGFRVGAWFEVGFRLADDVSLDTRGLLQATQTGFNVGSRVELRFGPEYGAHIAVGGEGIFSVGGSVHLRLQWDTVPYLPMAATIEVSDFPSSLRDSAVRLLYDVTYPLENGLRLGLRAGYQARDHLIGGPTLGANASWDF